MKQKSRLTVLCIGMILSAAISAQAFQDSEPIALSAHFKLQPDSRQGVLVVEAEIPDGWNLYSTTTPRGGPKPLKFVVLDSEQFSITGPFEPAEDPLVKFAEVFSIVTEEFTELPIWSAPIEISEGVSSADVSIEMKITGQSCSAESGACVIVNEMLVAEFAGQLKTEELETNYSPNRAHVIWKGSVAQGDATPGSRVLVTLTADPTEDFKIYGYEAKSTGTVAQPTRIVLSKSNGWEVSEVSASHLPKTKAVAGETQKYYRDEVSWTFEMTIPADAPARDYRFDGYVAFQNCTDEMCDPPSAAQFVFNVRVGEGALEESEIGFKKSGRYGSVAKMADRKIKEKALRSSQDN